MGKIEKIPDWLHPYFWDVAQDELNIQKHESFIIERLLNEGDHCSLSWLFKVYEKEVIKDTVKKSRCLSIKTARCWQNYFELREDELWCTGICLAQEEKLF